MASCFGAKRGQDRMGRVYESRAGDYTTGIVGGVTRIDLILRSSSHCFFLIFSYDHLQFKIYNVDYEKT